MSLPRGTKRKPTSIHLITGTHRKDRQPPDEPKAPPTDYDPPIPLSARERAAWDENIETFRRLDMLTDADFGMLARYCKAWIGLLDLDAKVAEFGWVVKGQTGPTQSPYARLWFHMTDRVMRFQENLGMSPTSRARLRTVHGVQKPASKLDKFSKTG